MGSWFKHLSQISLFGLYIETHSESRQLSIQCVWLSVVIRTPVILRIQWQVNFIAVSVDIVKGCRCVQSMRMSSELGVTESLGDPVDQIWRSHQQCIAKLCFS